MKFRIKEKYLIRHEILRYLYEKIKNEPLDTIDLQNSVTEFKKMAEDLKIDAKLLREYHQGLHAFGKDEDHVKCFKIGPVYHIGIEEKGVYAYLDDYWLREGRKEVNERIYDKTKWLVPLIALLVTAGSVLYTIIKTERLSSKIQKIQKEVEQMKNKDSLPIQSVSPYDSSRH